MTAVLFAVAAVVVSGPLPVEQATWFAQSLPVVPKGLTWQTVYRARIAATGEVLSCIVIATSGAKVVDDATCAIVRTKGRFLPARDASGAPVESDALASSVWPFFNLRPGMADSLPEKGTADYPRLALHMRWEGTTTFSVDIGPDGRARHCTVAESSGHAILDEAACKLIVGRFRFSPARNQDAPIWSAVTDKIRWKLPR